jgi:hypothetical protein
MTIKIDSPGLSGSRRMGVAESVAGDVVIWRTAHVGWGSLQIRKPANALSGTTGF